jgi:hypothetical protein
MMVGLSVVQKSGGHPAMGTGGTSELPVRRSPGLPVTGFLGLVVISRDGAGKSPLGVFLTPFHLLGDLGQFLPQNRTE